MYKCPQCEQLKHILIWRTKYDKIGYLCEDCWIVLHKRLRQVGVVKKDW